VRAKQNSALPIRSARLYRRVPKEAVPREP
jgi:hypothetical protein